VSKREKVTGIDNRGTAETPFGFVNLSDGTRVGFGSHRDDPNPLAIWWCRDTAQDIHPLTVESVRIALARKFPTLAAMDVKEDVG
jgi:hypothetical protein